RPQPIGRRLDRARRPRSCFRRERRCGYVCALRRGGGSPHACQWQARRDAFRSSLNFQGRQYHHRPGDRRREGRERDHSLRRPAAAIQGVGEGHVHAQAIALSAVPIYQELARRIGLERYREWLARLDFGNRQAGTIVDTFWLDGPLEISAVEEAHFAARLAQQKLAASIRSQSIARDIIRLEGRDDKLL